ncbi:MAG: DNA recombination protein RmuC [Saprospiraceae bacterium]|nr:DNA recombination protein RmuC [Saprospiraceae bacterium]MDW8229187.1 DNA recombination protein RmuC [Saprospiraceae bacterium]
MDNTLLLLVGAIVLVLVVLLLLKRAPVGENVSAEVYRDLQAQNEVLQKALQAKEQELRDAVAQIAAQAQTLAHQRDQLERQKAEQEQLAKQMRLEFEQLANRLFEEKSQRFTEQNAQQLHQTLAPLREKIREFEASIERKFTDETRDKASLRKEIEQLVALNQQLSQDARNLTAALKGQSKVQGDWGEHQLEVLLENAGLLRGEHFVAQATFRDDDRQTKRPDYIVRLPQQRHLIIDAKVSLTAFERYCSEDDPEARERHLRAHVDSLRGHVQQLGSKNYHALYQIHTPDFVLLYVPLDGAVSTAMQVYPDLLREGLERNVVIVTNSTLAVILRIVTHIWRQEKQNRSALEIARQSGLLYDRLVAFVEDLRTVGDRLNGAQKAYDDAMRKLTTGARPGDTIIGRAERIREMGAKATRQLPPELFEGIAEEADEGEESS